MKKILSVLIAVIAVLQLSAQSLNIQNYSGSMYVTRIEMLSCPRYNSYEDHAILSSEKCLPLPNMAKIKFDFEHDIINMDDKDEKIVSKSLKKYSTSNGWNIVIYLKVENSNSKYEFVCREYGEPYFQMMGDGEGEKSIFRRYLSTSPSNTSLEESYLQMLQMLGR